MANPLMQAALEYESKGFSVIPLKPKDKIPLIPSWVEFQSERATREQIGSWWRTWPTANIGIVTGQASGLDVIDTDSPEAATAIKPVLGDMTEVAIAATGKAFHLYYAHDGVTRPNKAGIRPQIDFRGDGGYVVAPPSIHANGKTYEWIKPINGHLRNLPEEFIRLMDAPADSTGSARVRFDTAAALQGLPEGQRDQGVYKLACKLRGADIPYDVAVELCEQAAANCVPPFRDARRKVDSAYKFPAGHSQESQQPQTSLWPEPMTIKEFDLRPQPEQRWIWQDSIPFASTSQIVGQPRHGKSTFAFNLALAISRGADFLGRKTTRVPVLYVSIDNSEEEIRDIKSRLGCRGEDNFYLHIGDVPQDPLSGLWPMIEKYGIKFIVIDTFMRFFRLTELKNEAMANTMGPVAIQAQERGIHIMYLHHAGKAISGGLTAGLGGIVGKGMTPWYFEISRIPDSQQRIFTSDHRAGKPFNQCYIKIDPKTGWSYIAGNADAAYVESAIPKIIEFVKAQPYSNEREIRASLAARGLHVSLAIKRLMNEGELEFDKGGPRGGKRFFVPAGLSSFYGTDL